MPETTSDEHFDRLAAAFAGRPDGSASLSTPARPGDDDARRYLVEEARVSVSARSATR